MRQSYQKSFQQQSTCFVTQSHVSIAEFNYKHWPKWHHQVPLWSNVVLQVPLIIFAWTCVVIVQWNQKPQHRSPFRILFNCS